MVCDNRICAIEQTAASHDAGREKIAVLLIFFYRDRRFFQLVDIVKNLFQRFRVGRPEELSVRDLCDFLQAGLVELNALVLIHDVAEHVGKRFPVRGLKTGAGAMPLMPAPIA